MRSRKFFSVVILLLGLFLVGCLGKTSLDEKRTRVVPQRGKAVSNQSTGDGKIKVFMMGRSVMAGWFEHWGSDTVEPVEKGHFVLYYRELESPPGIVRSVENHVNQIQAKNSLVFFKFCFEDFWGGSKEEAKQNLLTNKEYIQQVYRIVVEKNHLKLIIGNALPKVEAYTDSYLVWNHREYNRWLREFAEKHRGKVFVFDQYSILADGEGNLKAKYAVSREDSHLNEQAYRDLDTKFFQFLEENF